MAEARAVNAEFLRSWPLPSARGDKDSRGAVVVVAGSTQMPGAAILAATAAMRAGAGKLQIGTASSVAVQLAVAVPEALVFSLQETANGAIARTASDEIGRRIDGADALVVGPGFNGANVADELMRALAPDFHTAAVIDAAAMHCLRQAPHTFSANRGQTIITPHAGELASLLQISRDAIDAEPEQYAQQSAVRFGTIVVLKGQRTIIAVPAGDTLVHVDGDPGLGTSGSGDMLAGLIGGLLARGANPLQAAAWGVFVHGRAGAELARRIGVGYLARELAAEVPSIMRWLNP